MKKPCPIDLSLMERLKAGSHTSTVPSKDKSLEQVFKLRLKGTMPQLANVKDDPNQQQYAEDGAAISPQKTIKFKPCEVEVSPAARKAGGSLTTVVASKEKTTEIVYKLTLKGKMPAIAEARRDPAEAMAIAAAEKEAEL